MDTITREQFHQWKKMDETQYILGLVEQYVAECTDTLLSGQTLGNPEETGKIIGKIHGLRFIIDIDYQ
jgi:hypothetical protein